MNWTNTLYHCIGLSPPSQVLGENEKKKFLVASCILINYGCGFFFSYGDILPNTPEEKWVATVCMLWGVVLFGYILGDLASLLTNADAQRSRYIHRLNTIREHLKEARVSEPLKKKVLGYYEYLVLFQSLQHPHHKVLSAMIPYICAVA